jgi:hypothetical protein
MADRLEYHLAWSLENFKGKKRDKIYSLRLMIMAADWVIDFISINQVKHHFA